MERTTVDRHSPPHPTAAAFVRDIEQTFRNRGLDATLRVLNGHARYRFTGVYAFDPPLLRNLALFDRENPSLQTISHITPLREAYCSIVHETNAVFTTPDAARDDVVTDHPARHTYMSYYGVPLRASDGALWGVLCYFDYRPRTMPSAKIPLLEAVARVLGPLIGRR
jgi:GAF domain-containing protein